jgi:hypothetical protein
MSLLKIFKYLTKDVSMSSVLPFQKKNGTKTNNMVPEKKILHPPTILLTTETSELKN